MVSLSPLSLSFSHAPCRNLVTNSVKFTHEGTVVLRAWAADGRLHLTVEDTGPGIADPTKLFAKYEQLDQHVQGTGIGKLIECVKLL